MCISLFPLRMPSLKETIKTRLPKSAIRGIRGARRFLNLSIRDQGRYFLHRFVLLQEILRFPPIPLSPPGSAPEVRLLTCHAHAWLSLYALYSFYHTTGLHLPLVLHDDGTLTQQDLSLYARLFPGMTCVTRSDADRQMEAQLSDYPDILLWRQTFSLAPKVLDLPMLATPPFFILLDSDLYFFNRPREFLDHLSACHNGARYNVFGYNSKTAYALARWQVQASTGIDLPKRLNSGFGIVHSDCLDLATIRTLLAQQDLLHQPFWMEQTAYAALSARYGLNMLPENDYQIVSGPKPREAVMRHYVSTHRHLFYAEAIPHAMRHRS